MLMFLNQKNARQVSIFDFKSQFTLIACIRSNVFDTQHRKRCKNNSLPPIKACSLCIPFLKVKILDRYKNNFI